MMIAKVQCYGPVDGFCGHTHRTIQGAAQCLYQHRRHMAANGGFSDRYPRPLEKGGPDIAMDILGAADRLEMLAMIAHR